ncbi:uncharacterized protein [Apostichopus japonicus]|uniref:uncharacterized protein isoform X22 n=1 Tax=Stichopus japonicus TaxID=307972 RepID=UPI003AB5D4CE
MAGRDNTPNGFGAFKVYMASQLTGSQIAQLSTFFDFSRALFDKVEGNGLAFVNTLVDRGTIDETDISRLLEALEVIKLCGIQKRFQKKFRSCMEVATQDEPSPTQKGELSKTNTHGNFSTGKRQDDTKPVFISFSSKDKTKVEEIVATFEEALGPKTCWMYTTGIQGGQNIDREIVRAVDKAKVVICMISQTYIDSDECEKEVMLAVNRKKEIIEVRIESVNRHYKDKHGDESAVELTFARRSYIDLTGEDMEKKMQELIKRIQELISQEDNQSTEEQVPSPLKPSPTPEGGKPSKTSTDGEQVPSPLKPSPTPEEGEPSKTSTDEEQVPSPLKPSPTPEGGEPSKTSTDEEQVPSPLKPSPTPEGGEPSSTDGKFSTGKKQGKSCLTASTETRDSKVNPYFCAYCQIIFEESWQHQYHTETEKHKENINIKKDDEKWAYGEPPLGITDGKFELCPKQSGECSGCSHAHSQKELDEWNKRHEYCLEALYNYQPLPSEDMTDQTTKMKTLVEKYEEEKQKNSGDIMYVDKLSYLSALDQIIAKGSEGALIFVGKYEDEYVAVKRIQTIQREEDLCKMMQDEDMHNVVKMICIGKDNFFYYVVTPLCECDLESFIKAGSAPSQLQQIELCLDILSGLKSLHSFGVVHRDLKPRNVLINKKGEALLTDFGISRICIGASTSVTALVGSLLWLPSECIAAVEEKRFSKASDIQTAGYLVYYILSNGHHPFEASDPNDTVLLQDNIKKGMFQLLHLGNFPENCKSLLTKMLDKEVKNRPGIEDCLQEMKEVKSLLIQQLSEEIQPSLPGVEVLCGESSIDMTKDRNSKQTWSFRVKSGNRNLKNISFRHNDSRELFFFPSPENQPCPKELFAKDMKTDSEGYACFEVHFQAKEDSGLFDEQVIFDFGEKPFLCQQLLVWIDPKSPTQ